MDTQVPKKAFDDKVHYDVSLPSGCEECFWCGGIRQKDTMKKSSNRGATIYVCDKCG